MREEPMLWVVSGFSSAGKSRLLRSPRIRELTSLPADAPVLFPQDIRERPTIERGSYLHYNLFRPVARALRGRGEPLGFAADPMWEDLLEMPVRKKAVLVNVDKETLLRRTERRTEVEPGSDGYDAERFVGFLRWVDTDAVCDAWRAELERHRIPLVELDGVEFAQRRRHRRRWRRRFRARFAGGAG